MRMPAMTSPLPTARPARFICAWRWVWKAGASMPWAPSVSAMARAAMAPMVMASVASEKSVEPMVSSGGLIKISPVRNCASEACMFCSVRILIICSDTPKMDCSWSRFSSPELILTAMMMSAPMARATSMGRLRVRPPSRYRRWLISYGAMAPGTDIEARITSARRPRSNTTILPDSASVAMPRKRIGNWSNSTMPGAKRVMRENSASSFCPEMAPAGNCTPSRLMPNSSPNRRAWSSSLRKKLRSPRGLVSVNKSPQSARPSRSSSSAMGVPEA